MLDTCERIAREKYAPFNRTVDTEEPRFDGEKVHPAAGHPRCARLSPSPACSPRRRTTTVGGMQLPYTVRDGGQQLLRDGAWASAPGRMLTSGNANLLMVHGTPMQQ